MNRQHAVSAANRFGLGARPGEIDSITDPQEWLLAQLRMPASEPALAELPGSLEYLRQDIALRQTRRESRQRGPAGGAMPLARRQRQAQLHELLLRHQVAVASPTSFRERMVRFWSNHFAVSVDKRVAAPYAAPMEREAIRPHVLGRFADMLLAVETHPAMLRFLDNTRSAGADSKLAVRAHRRNPERELGLNENLAREILELHTLGVQGGYSQADVTELAKAITGWSVPAPQDFERGAPVRAFMFRANAHEGGSRVVMGKRYAEDGLASTLR